MNTTENKQSANTLSWSDERLRQLVENVTDYAIYITDLDGRIEAWNIGAERLFGYSAEEILGQLVDIIFTPEDRAKGAPAEEMKQAREVGCSSDERWVMSKDGSRFFVSGVLTPLYNNGELTGYAKIARDLTERVQMEEELRSARENLEIKVEERTDELKQEIMVRKRSEERTVRLLRQIVSTQEDERKRIAREIHDQLGQQLTALRFTLESLKEQSEKGLDLNEQIEKLQEMTKRLDSEVDFLAWELRPSVLDDLGLVVALDKFVQEWSGHYRILAEFHTSGLGKKRLQPDIEINLYRIAQEALNNIVKHAKANQVGVLLELVNDDVTLIVEDDGKGFEPSDKEDLTADDRGMGLLGMRERAALIGGTLEIESAPGEGTTIFARIPVRFNHETET